MKRWIGGALGALTLLAVAESAQAFLYVPGNNSRSGDLVAVYVKNGFELILNLGPVEDVGPGEVVSFEVPGEFDGTLEGAKFTALTVPNPNAVFSGLGLDPPLAQGNIALTTLADPTTIIFNQIGEAQSQLDPSGAATAWLTLLGTIPAAGQSGVVSNTNTEALIQSTLFASYKGNIGFSSDAIANTLTISTATSIVAGETQAYEIPLYTVRQLVTLVSGDFVFNTTATELGTLTGDDGSSGTAILSLVVPEPGSFAIGAVAAASLGWIARRRRAC
jgi:hypothetical protein